VVAFRSSHSRQVAVSPGVVTFRSSHREASRSQFVYGHTEIESQRGMSREKWRSINEILGRQRSSTSNNSSTISADVMASFF